MWKELYSDDFLIAEDKRLILKLIQVEGDENFPEGLEFSVQYLYFKDDEWLQIVRIDNQLHDGKSGVHIHTLKREKVEWTDMSFYEAREKIIEIAERIIKNIIERV